MTAAGYRAITALSIVMMVWAGFDSEPVISALFGLIAIGGLIGEGE